MAWLHGTTRFSQLSTWVVAVIGLLKLLISHYYWTGVVIIVIYPEWSFMCLTQYTVNT